MLFPSVYCLTLISSCSQCSELRKIFLVALEAVTCCSMVGCPTVFSSFFYSENSYGFVSREGKGAGKG